MAVAHVEVDGLHLHGTAAHRPYLEAVLRREREVLMAELFRRAVHPGAVVLDLGAFVGYFALLAARESGPEGRVYAFEPDPRDRPWLERNVEANGLGDRVDVVPMAVSDHSGP